MYILPIYNFQRTDNKNIYISNLAAVLHDISSISMIV